MHWRGATALNFAWFACWIWNRPNRCEQWVCKVCTPWDLCKTCLQVTMPLLHTLGVVVSFWFALFVVDRTMRKHRPCKSTYQQNLDEWGVSVSFAHVRFYTTRFNRLFHSIGNYNKPACRFWFGLGAFIGVALMLTSMVVLSFRCAVHGGQAARCRRHRQSLPGVHAVCGEGVCVMH